MAVSSSKGSLHKVNGNGRNRIKTISNIPEEESETAKLKHHPDFGRFGNTICFPTIFSPR